MAFLYALPGAAAQGMIWGIMAIGVYLTYKILDVADLTVDGSFATGGATLEDVELFAKHCKGKKVKAAGGIKSPEDAVRFINAGASRLGSSSLLKMLRDAEDEIL